MDFCPNCESMLKQYERDGTLMDDCEVCGWGKESTSFVISDTVHTGGNYQDPNSMRYVRYSKSLPRTNKRRCPNKKCPSRKDKALQEAVMIEDANKMTQMFVCVECNHKWDSA